MFLTLNWRFICLDDIVVVGSLKSLWRAFSSWNRCDLRHGEFCDQETVHPMDGGKSGSDPDPDWTSGIFHIRHCHEGEQTILSVPVITRGRFHKGFCAVTPNFCALRPTFEKLFTGAKVRRKAQTMGAGCETFYEIDPSIG